MSAEIMQALARELDRRLNGAARPARNGFVLLVFPLGVDVMANYVSNCERIDMVAALKSVLARWEGQPDARGRA